jgi:hypothetical protein
MNLLHLCIIALIMYKCVGYKLIASFYIWVVLISLFISSFFVRPIIKYIIFAILVIYGHNIQFFFDFSSCIYKSFRYRKKNLENNYVTRILVTDLFNKFFRVSHNFEKIPKKSTIFISNYVKDRIENLACIMLPVNICPVMSTALTFLTKFITPVIIKGNSNQYDKMKEKINEMLSKGIYVFIYIEKIHSSITDNDFGVIRNGVFNIAKDLDTTITPIAFDRILYNKYAILVKQNYQICVGDTFKVDNVNDVKYKTRRFFRDKIKYFSKTKFEECY